jgi:hypothetical protein
MSITSRDLPDDGIKSDVCIFRQSQIKHYENFLMHDNLVHKVVTHDGRVFYCIKFVRINDNIKFPFH